MKGNLFEFSAYCCRKTCVSFLVVEYMRAGSSPTLACQKAIDRVVSLARECNCNLNSLHVCVTMSY
jgi:hypothetical protein